MMRYSQTGLHLTEQFEGCKLVSYQDSGGVWTIGYGHTRGVVEGTFCTQAQAEEWLRDDITYAECRVNALVTVPLTQNEFDALVDFQFNTGALETSTMLRLLNAGSYKLAAAEFEKWDHVHGKVIAGLLRRRQAEEAEFNAEETGQGQASGASSGV